MGKTFVMVKPDGVQRGLVGRIIQRFEEKGLKLVALKMLWIDRELASIHYAEHKGKAFYEGLIDYITSGPVVAMVLQGKDAVEVARHMMGETDPVSASPGTIRGDFALEISRNVIHGSDSEKSAEREIQLFFREQEIMDYERMDEDWLYR